MLKKYEKGKNAQNMWFNKTKLKINLLVENRDKNL